MPIYRYGGQLLRRDVFGGIAGAQACCCDEVELGCPCEFCELVDGVRQTPAYQYLTFSGVAQGTGGSPCSDWNDWNQTFRVPQWEFNCCNYFARGPGACGADAYPDYPLLSTIPCDGIIECYESGSGFEVAVLRCDNVFGGGFAQAHFFNSYPSTEVPCMDVGTVVNDQDPGLERTYVDFFNASVSASSTY